MKTHDMIMGQRLPGFTGFGSITTNLGEVQNRGFELSLNTLNIQNRDFEWRSTLSFSIYKNEIKHLYYEYEDVLNEAGEVIGRKEMDDTSNGWFIGQSIGTIWDYEMDGIWQADEAAEAAKVGQRPGDPKVVNHYTADDKEDGTPVYNEKDKVFLGKKNPPIHWSFRNEFTLWKDLNISFSMYSYMGHKSLEGYYLNQDNGGSLITYNSNTFKKRYWTPENPSTEYTSAGYIPYDKHEFYKKMNYVQLKNITLGYNLPKSILNPIGITALNVNASINNVCTFSNVKNAMNFDGTDTNADIITCYPTARSYMLGLNLTF